MHKNTSRLERFVGCLLGGAIGDALGMPLEMLPSASIRSVFQLPIRSFMDAVEGAPCYSYGLKRGMYTDDTQGSRATAQALIETKSCSPLVVADALRRWLFEESLGQAPRYPGTTTHRAMSNFAESNDPVTCGVLSDNCGAAIRIAPIALWHATLDEKEFLEQVQSVAQITHTGVAAIDGAKIVATLIRDAFHGGPRSLKEIIEMCQSVQMKRGLEIAESGLRKGHGPVIVAEELGSGSRAYEVIPLSVFHLYATAFEFEPAIHGGLDTFHPSGLDMDSILSIIGTLAGVTQPQGVLRSIWKDDVEDSKTIQNEATELAAIIDARL
jgi:ADP-ribosyl-[dinitrogen reductase] hydrolase